MFFGLVFFLLMILPCQLIFLGLFHFWIITYYSLYCFWACLPCKFCTGVRACFQWLSFGLVLARVQRIALVSFRFQICPGVRACFQWLSFAVVCSSERSNFWACFGLVFSANFWANSNTKFSITFQLFCTQNKQKNNRYFLRA